MALHGIEKEIASPFRPNYIRLLPPGEVITEKIGEMDIDEAEFARRCGLPWNVHKDSTKAQIAVQWRFNETFRC